MANSLANILPKILARALIVLRETAVMPRLVNADYGTEAAMKGDTIDVPIPTAVAVIDVVPASVPPTPGDTTPNKVQIKLDNWKQNTPIHLTDKEMTEIDRNEHFLPSQLGEAIRGLANSVNDTILAEYRTEDRGIFGFTGTAGTTPFATTVDGATQARKLLNQQLAPKGMRRGVLDHDADANAVALDQFANAEQTLSNLVKIEGEIGRKYGIDWVADDAVVTHTAGTIVDGSSGRRLAVNNGGGYAIGIDIIDVDEGAFTTIVGTVVNGDIISFAGHAQTYTIVDNTGSSEFAGAPPRNVHCDWWKRHHRVEVLPGIDVRCP